MRMRAVSTAEAGDVVGAWADTCVRPLCTPTEDRPDGALEHLADDFFRVAAEAPFREFTDFARPVLLVAWSRVLFLVATAQITPDLVFHDVADELHGERLLPVLLRERMALLRCPDGWHRPQGGPSAPPAPTSWRRH